MIRLTFTPNRGYAGTLGWELRSANGSWVVTSWGVKLRYRRNLMSFTHYSVVEQIAVRGWPDHEKGCRFGGGAWKGTHHQAGFYHTNIILVNQEPAECHLTFCCKRIPHSWQHSGSTFSLQLLVNHSATYINKLQNVHTTSNNKKNL